ncbi:MAG: hypothetical protein ACXVEF_19300 [Polyangiales bacterium]
MSAPVAAYPMPSVALPTPVMQKAAAAALPVTPAPSPKDYVVVPPRGTLAAGRWEAKPSTIWIVVAVGAILVLGWALFRVRRAASAKRRQLESLVTLRRP